MKKKNAIIPMITVIAVRHICRVLHAPEFNQHYFAINSYNCYMPLNLIYFIILKIIKKY